MTKMLNFCEALVIICGGESGKMTRVEWGDKKEYGLIRHDKLQIHTKGRFHDWILSNGDLLAEDWEII